MPVLTLRQLCAEKIIESGIFAKVDQANRRIELTKSLQSTLLQAVIDDDRILVRALLSAHPDLLVPCAFSLPESVHSQYTWQTFKPEPALAMALKRNQTEMLRIIVEAVENASDKLTAEQRAVILTQWDVAEVSLKSVIKRSEQFTDMPEVGFQALIDVIKLEAFPDGPEGRLSEETENALQKFRETLLPRGAIKLDDYCEIMHLLLTAYQAYNQAFEPFPNWPQRDVFCIKVIGYIQSLLPVEIAKMFCEGLYSVVKQDQPISARAADLRLRSGQRFYRDGLDDERGLGRCFLVGGLDGGARCLGAVVGFDRFDWLDVFGKLCHAKTTELGRLRGRTRKCLQPQCAERSRTHNPSCLIL
jgi:hypothetical protein